MSEMEQYKRYMNRVHAPESACTEVKNMISERAFRKPIYAKRRVLLLAAAAALLLALSLTAYAKGPTIFGWGGNFEVRRDEQGETMEAVLHTEKLTEPVRFEEERMIFIVNGEELDITDRVSETQAFTYQYTDAEGITHGWLVGKNGPEPTNYGYGEYLATDKGWFTGYTARVNLDPDSDGPAWLRNGKAELGVTW